MTPTVYKNLRTSQIPSVSLTFLYLIKTLQLSLSLNVVCGECFETSKYFLTSWVDSKTRFNFLHDWTSVVSVLLAKLVGI